MQKTETRNYEHLGRVFKEKLGPKDRMNVPPIKLRLKDENDSILPKDKRIQAFFNLKKPTNKKDIQMFCGMLASLQSWNPNIPMNIPILRKAAGSRVKVEWNEELEAEYQAGMAIMKNPNRLIPYYPTIMLCLVIDGARFLLIQYMNNRKPENRITIINAGSCLFPDDKDYSPVEAEAFCFV